MSVVPVILLFAGVASAQTPDTTGTTVSGIVHDSIARRPLAGAMVQLVAAEGQPGFVRAVESDSLGRYLMTGVPDGQYMLGFLHPMLDSLGLAPPVREVHVIRQHPVREHLAIPSPRQIRAAICGPTSREDSGAVVVGTVRDAANGNPIENVVVTGEWMELSIRAGGMVRKLEKLSAKTGDNGWFALCNVPRDGLMELVAVRGTDSTARIELHVPNDGFARSELYLGESPAVAGGPAGRSGTGRLRGTVVAAAPDGRPLTGAQVSIVGGPQAQTNELGEWTLVGIASGTRMLEVRAVGFYPERRAVNVFAGAAPVHITLSTLQAVLDTVRVRANRLTDRNLVEFNERRRASGTGRFLTAADIAKRNPYFASDIFKSVPGVYVDSGVRMRGAFGECSPALYIDGWPIPAMAELTREDIDNWVQPERISAIEVYTDQVPARFQQAMQGCGAIVIWLK